jgi:hypothetical protein
MKKFIVVLLILYFIIAAPLTIITYNLNRTFFNLEFYEKKFDESDFYQSITDTLASSMANSQYLNIAGNSLLTTEELQTIVKTIIVPDWLEEQTQIIMAGVFGLFDLNEDPRQVKIIIDLSAKKDQVEQILQAKIEDKVNNLPICTPDSINISAESINMDKICRPAGVDPTQFIEQNNLDIAKLLVNIPEQFNLIEFLENGMILKQKESVSSSTASNFWQNITTFRNVITFLKYLYIASWFLLPLSLILIILLSLPHFKSILRRLGLALLFPSLFLLIISLAPNITAELFLKNIIFFQPSLAVATNIIKKKNVPTNNHG